MGRGGREAMRFLSCLHGSILAHHASTLAVRAPTPSARPAGHRCRASYGRGKEARRGEDFCFHCLQRLGKGLRLASAASHEKARGAVPPPCRAAFLPLPTSSTSITPRLATAATSCVAAVDCGSTLTGRTRERTGVAPHVCAGLPISPDGRLDPTKPNRSWKPSFVVGRFRLLQRGGTAIRQNHRVPWSLLASNLASLAPFES